MSRLWAWALEHGDAVRPIFLTETVKRLAPPKPLSFAAWQKKYPESAVAGKGKTKGKNPITKGKGKTKVLEVSSEEDNSDIEEMLVDGPILQIPEDHKALHHAIRMVITQLGEKNFENISWKPENFTATSPTSPTLIANHLAFIIQNNTNNMKMSDVSKRSRKRHFDRTLKSFMDQFFERQSLHEHLIQYSSIALAREALNNLIRQLNGEDIDSDDDTNLDTSNDLCFLDLLIPPKPDQRLRRPAEEDADDPIESAVEWQPIETQIRNMGRAMKSISAALEAREEGSRQAIVLEYCNFIDVGDSPVCPSVFVHR